MYYNIIEYNILYHRIEQDRIDILYNIEQNRLNHDDDNNNDDNDNDTYTSTSIYIYIVMIIIIIYIILIM